MTAEWSDRRPAGWPSEQPVWAITALVLAVAMIPGGNSGTSYWFPES